MKDIKQMQKQKQKQLTSLWLALYLDMPKMLNLMSSARESHSNGSDQFSTALEPSGQEDATGVTEAATAFNNVLSSDFLSYNLS